MQIALSDNPRDYGLPSDHFRPRQKEMAQKCVNLAPGTVLLCEAPCGYGKSFLPGVVSYFRPGTTVLVISTDLQRQYETMIPFFGCVWGTGRPPNYCVHPEHVAQFQAVYGVKPFRSECKYPKSSECEYIGSCPYEISKQECIDARARVFNVHYARYAGWWRRLLNEEADLFADECHNLPISLSGLVSVEMREDYRKRYNLPPFPLALGGAPVMLKRAAQWASRAEQVLLPLTKAKDIKLQRRATNKRNELGQLARTLGEVDEAEWYVESRPGDKFFARPVVPGPYSSLLLDRHARSYVLMSATIGNESGAAVLAGELAIDDYQFVSYPHIFPEEIRPVVFYKDSPRLNYKSPPEDYQKQVEMITKLLNEHKGQKGLIATASWRHVDIIARGLTKHGFENRIFVPKGDRTSEIEKFKQSEDGTVAISPSWGEGLSFDDDLCRFIIVAKMPYLSLADPVVRLRLKRKGGKSWMDWNTALKVVQTSGRGTRHENDYSITYILDANWPNVARMAPKWYSWERV